ncbi:hypothetical protein E2320_001632 [Naja naja]|nr:hypothetical protein E2320_001632 [Naja naja]
MPIHPFESVILGCLGATGPGEALSEAFGCEFENVEITLRDRIVVGMRDLRLQIKLITKKSISLKEVMEEARAAGILEKPAAKVEKSESVHSAWGTTSKYQEEGEIGELSEEEEEEIHRACNSLTAQADFGLGASCCAAGRQCAVRA